MKNHQEYDYIILGAGSAGCVLANELSEDPNNSVLILEAGPMDRKLLIHMPAGVYSVYKDPSINWNYDSEAESQLENRNIMLPRGKVIGGSSSINSMVYMRGHPQDYDYWASRYALPAWSYERCLPYFKKCESSDRGASDWRGANGRLGVTRARLKNPLFDAFIEAGSQSGQGTTDDPNGYKPEGVARLDSTTKHGRRSSAAVAHLRPALSRANLKLMHHALVTRIVIEHGRATGVEFKHGGELQVVHAAKEVILSAGAIKSPQLLMLSGVGPSGHISRFNIAPIHHLPGVGQNLQDHLSISVIYEARKPVTFHNVGSPLKKFLLGCQWLLTRRGFVASNIWEAGGHIRGYKEVEFPNLQYHFAPIHAEYTGTKIELFQAFTTQLDQLRPRSRGQVRLLSADPAHRPAAHFNYLSDPFDVDEMIQAVKRIRELISQPAFDEFRGKELMPGPDVVSDQDIDQFVRATTTTDYHPSCSCRMGNDEMAVVDQEMRVHGLQGLRVVDASVMPDIVSGNLNAPTQMMALKASDLILGRNPLPEFKAQFHFDQKL
ncbi:MAG: choline dehydrogenase [bacterium]